jgi:hypothetical protein
MKRLLALLLALAASEAHADPINNYSTTTPDCADFSRMLTVTAAKPDGSGRLYRLTVKLLTVGAPDMNAQAAALIPLLQTKYDDPTAPASNALPYKTWASPLNWLVLGKSVLGVGCAQPQ